MKRIFTLLILFVALGVSTSQAQYTRNNNENEKETRRYEPGVYQDERGEYRWQTIERRVWIPEYRTPGIFGIGSRTIPGHYEVRSTNRVKVYTNSEYENRQQSQGEKKHPHGMPPGQRKKMQKNRNDNDQRWNNEDDDHRDKKGKTKGKKNDHDDDNRYDHDDND
jgi:hypothetical protein